MLDSKTIRKIWDMDDAEDAARLSVVGDCSGSLPRSDSMTWVCLSHQRPNDGELVLVADNELDRPMVGVFRFDGDPRFHPFVQLDGGGVLKFKPSQPFHWARISMPIV